jgi:MoxR-like ATPase
MQNLHDVIKGGLTAAKPIKFLILGDPGSGKTSMHKAICEEIGAHRLHLTPAIDEPTDHKGFPFIFEGRAYFIPFNNLETILNWEGGESGEQLLVIDLDDLGQAMEAVQAALMPQIQSGIINGQEFKRPDLIRWIGSTNDTSGNNGVGGLIEPLKGRFHTILTYRPHIRDFTFIAMEIGIADEIIAFLNYRPDHLTRSGEIDPAAMEKHPSPRTWEHASDILALCRELGLSNADRLELMAGTVGRGAAVEFCAFLESSQDFPTAQEVASNPMGARLPDDMALYFAMAIMLLKNVNAGNLGPFLEYLKRFKKREVLTFWLNRVVKSIAAETAKSGKKGAQNWFFNHHVCNDELVIELLPVLMAAN